MNKWIFTILILVAVAFLLAVSTPFWYEKINNFLINAHPMNIISSAFEHEGNIPSTYTCDGANINPPLTFRAVPPKAQSIALIVDDPDAPVGTFVHWLVWNISSSTDGVSEDSVPQGSIEGLTSFGSQGYGGPCPPNGAHRYFFKLYALDTTLDLEEGANKEALVSAMKGHIIAEAELMGGYKRK